ncbi:MAG TPA: hypothetical protein VKP13_17220 [Nitrospira sp.]|nr:hypothetical protein [Nitrospira sp.]
MACVAVTGEVMKMRWSRYVSLRLAPHVLTLAVLLLPVIGCSGFKVRTQASSELPRYQVRTVALVPFSAMRTPQVRDIGDSSVSPPKGARGSSEDMVLTVPLSTEPQLRQTVTVPGYAAEKITQLFWSRLRNRKDVVVLSPSEAAKSAVSASGETAKATPEAGAAAVAKTLKADAALIGEVLVYQERVGSRLGANPPASVGFEVKAVAADGQVLWVGNYYERQRPMIEDFLGFLQRWGMFVTAEELARYGVDGILQEFPFGTAGE